MARRQQRVSGLALVGGAVACFLLRGTFFVTSIRGSQVISRTARQASGFDSTSAPADSARRTGRINVDLTKDHGEKWEMVDSILKGKKAESAEAMLRARFTALRYKDAKFLASTEEQEPGQSKQACIDKWMKAMGLLETDIFDFFAGLSGGERIDTFKEPDRLEILGTDGDEVEFVIVGKNGQFSHERNKFGPDAKWGYILTLEGLETQMSYNKEKA